MLYWETRRTAINATRLEEIDRVNRGERRGPRGRDDEPPVDAIGRRFRPRKCHSKRLAFFEDPIPND